MQETEEMQVWSLGWEDPMEEGMATHSRILTWKVSWAFPGGLQSMGLQRIGHSWSNLACTHKYLCLPLKPCLLRYFLHRDLPLEKLKLTSKERIPLCCYQPCWWPSKIFLHGGKKPFCPLHGHIPSYVCLPTSPAARQQRHTLGTCTTDGAKSRSPPSLWALPQPAPTRHRYWR